MSGFRSARGRSSPLGIAGPKFKSGQMWRPRYRSGRQHIRRAGGRDAAVGGLTRPVSAGRSGFESRRQPQADGGRAWCKPGGAKRNAPVPARGVHCFRRDSNPQAAESSRRPYACCPEGRVMPIAPQKHVQCRATESATPRSWGRAGRAPGPAAIRGSCTGPFSVGGAAAPRLGSRNRPGRAATGCARSTPRSAPPLVGVRRPG